MAHREIVRLTPNVTAGQVNQCLGVLLHHTAGKWLGDLAWLTRAGSGASCHVLIGKDGTRAVLAQDNAVTWHAGKSEFDHRLGKLVGLNRYMLGVEFEGNTLEAPLTDAQIESLVEWLTPRSAKYGWKLDDMTHHRIVSPGRKVDLEPSQFERCRAAAAKILPE